MEPRKLSHPKQRRGRFQDRSWETGSAPGKLYRHLIREDWRDAGLRGLIQLGEQACDFASQKRLGVIFLESSGLVENRCPHAGGRSFEHQIANQRESSDDAEPVEILEDGARDTRGLGLQAG